MAIKPILFNTEMVRATLDGRKTVIRCCVKYKYSNTDMKIRTDKYGTRIVEIQKDIEGETFGKNPDGSTWHKLLGYIEPKAPYQKGDILYVRETWNICNMNCEDNSITFIYRADKDEEKSEKTVIVSDEIYEKYEDSMAENNPEWRPSIHMPKEAARIWLKVMDVRVERLQEMKPVCVIKEGAYLDCWDCLNTYGESGSQCCYGAEEQCSQCDEVMMEWEKLWNSTIKKSDLDRYGWDANPYVWVIEFERCERAETDEHIHKSIER